MKLHFAVSQNDLSRKKWYD